MNLTKSLKETIIIRFKTGASMAEIADWYQQKPEKIKEIIRVAMVAYELIDKLDAVRNDERHRLTLEEAARARTLFDGDGK